jgi:hypothetical protein
MFNTDSYFVKGCTLDHKVCQDYATHGAYKDNPYIIVSDGCSTAIKSELGAQLLVRCAELTIKEFIDIDAFAPITDPKAFIEGFITRKMDAVAKSLELDYQTLSATLIFSFIYRAKLYIYCRGDGLISYRIKHIENGIETPYTFTHHLSYTTNAPYYLVYSINPIGDSRYKMLYGNGKLITKTIITDASGTESNISEDNHDSSMLISFPINDSDVLDYIMIGSDGFDSYKPMKAHINTNRIDLSYESILARATAFKVRGGACVQRRLSMMEIEDKKNMIEHTDDMSVAVIIEVPNVNS